MRDGVERRVARILERVRRGGDAALRALTRRFDGARRRRIEVTAAERRAGERQVGRATRAALRLAARRIAAFARRQKRSLRPFRLRERGVVLQQVLRPVRRVGLYVPGGRYPLCSTVLMGAIPARVAGCEQILLCTPPRPDGSILPEILAAAAEARVDRVFAVGGAQAIAAMAFGTRSVPAVDLIAGPGNRYVAAAKALLAGRVGIDFAAGPSELMVIADRTSDPVRVAADLLGQAEHDPEARLWLVAIGRGVVPRVRRRLRSALAALPAANRRAAAPAVAALRTRTVASEEAAAAAAERAAPEHLAVQTRAPRRLLPRLSCYGSLFLGGSSAVALGDYVSGPNHVLPTAGAARHTGGLSVLRFLKVLTVQEVDEGGARRLAPAAERLAAVEGLEAHRLSLAVRAGRGATRAVLFDFNGVLVDDETFHWRAFREVLAPLGIALSRARYDARYLAFDDRGALRAMLRDAGRRGTLPEAAVEGLLRRKRRLFRRLGDAAGVRVEPRVAALVRALAGRLPLAIVSGAARREILYALRPAGLARSFRSIVAAEDVSRSKPAPDGYLLALRRLGLGGGASCVAIEDSPGGIRAARAAGLRVLGVTTSYSAAALRRAGATTVARSAAALAEKAILG